MPGEAWAPPGQAVELWHRSKPSVRQAESVRQPQPARLHRASSPFVVRSSRRLLSKAVRQGQWKLHLPRKKEPVGAAPFARNAHIAPADRIGFKKPFLVDLDRDIGETTDVSDQHPDVVNRLLALAETMREDLGDYDRVGKNMRFFDPMQSRPTKPPVPAPAKPKAKKQAK